jgi:hypothetical protein
MAMRSWIGWGIRVRCSSMLFELDWKGFRVNSNNA